MLSCSRCDNELKAYESIVCTQCETFDDMLQNMRQDSLEHYYTMPFSPDAELEGTADQIRQKPNNF